MAKVAGPAIRRPAARAAETTFPKRGPVLFGRLFFADPAGFRLFPLRSALCIDRTSRGSRWQGFVAESRWPGHDRRGIARRSFNRCRRLCAVRCCRWRQSRAWPGRDQESGRSAPAQPPAPRPAIPTASIGASLSPGWAFRNRVLDVRRERSEPSQLVCSRTTLEARLPRRACSWARTGGSLYRVADYRVDTAPVSMCVCPRRKHMLACQQHDRSSGNRENFCCQRMIGSTIDLHPFAQAGL